MSRPSKAASVPHRVFSFEGNCASPFPMTATIADEGWDEFNKIIWGFQDFRDEFRHILTLRRKNNPKVKLCDIIYRGGYTLVSRKCRAVIEDFGGNAFFYPVRLEDEKGKFVPNVEYYIFETRNFPGGEWVPPEHWKQGKTANYRLCQKQVSGHHVFRSVFDNQPIFISEALKNRLSKEKFKYADYRSLDTFDVEWDPDVHLEPLLKTLAEDPVRKQVFIRRRLGWVKKYKPEWLSDIA